MNNQTRLFLADSVAMVTFSFVTGLGVELIFAGMTLTQSLLSRLFSIVPNQSMHL